MEQHAICARCGMLLEIEAVKAEGKRLLCKDCKARRQRKIRYGEYVCRPWHGDFDPDDNPLLDGKLFMPGVRICLHKDCCEPTHVIAAE